LEAAGLQTEAFPMLNSSPHWPSFEGNTAPP
jgi:hypothetical protein